MKKYELKIKVRYDDSCWIWKFINEMDCERNNDLPIFFESENGNFYLVMHGGKDGKLSSIDYTYNIQEIYDFYKFLAIKLNKKSINIISCNTGYISRIIDPKGIEIGPAINFCGDIYTQLTEDDYYRIKFEVNDDYNPMEDPNFIYEKIKDDFQWEEIKNEE